MSAVTTLSVVDAILKEVYEDKLRDQLQSEVITLKRIERTTEGVTNEVGGKYVTFPIRVRRNHGIGARAENQPLPVARAQKYKAARINLAYLYGAINVSGQTMELADKNFQAFASALQQEIDGLKQNLVKDTNRQVYGTSRGVLATITAAATANQVTVDNTQYLEVGMIIDIVDNVDDTIHGAEREITDIDTDTGVVTYSGADVITDAVDDQLIRSGSLNQEKVGFEEITDNTAPLYNIDPATEPVWQAVVNDNGGVNRSLSEGLMIKMVDDIRTKGGRTSVIFTSLGVRRAYFNLLVQQRQYVNTKQFDGGFNGLAFTTDWGEVPVVSDFDCQPNRMYFINEKELKLYQEGDWSFMNRDGSNWQRVITTEGNFDAYEAMMFKYCQIGTHRRNSQGLLDDITEAS